MSKIDHSLFNANEHALEQVTDLCPKCQSSLKIKHGKSGAFIGCSQYPECDFSKPLHEYETADVKVIEGSQCPVCDANLVIKKGRFGLFIGCSTFPACTYIESSKQSNDNKIKCPSCSVGYLTKRANKFGKQFYPCDNYPKCKYVLNSTPVAISCAACEWPVMIEKKTAQGLVLQCPQRACGYKQEQ
ncbi:topoisomerase DNA-binding C4 zinc finger domain-containing protein [Flavobacterium sp. W21_SRS_FM6]|uniref:DNA topoisomerase family protein n=1 Tax=Flavobacterium sp. W21_SRS_FM6 TaxID=3240268 RepID=UPI003F91BCD0